MHPAFGKKTLRFRAAAANAKPIDPRGVEMAEALRRITQPSNGQAMPAASDAVSRD